MIVAFASFWTEDVLDDSFLKYDLLTALLLSFNFPSFNVYASFSRSI